MARTNTSAENCRMMGDRREELREREAEEDEMARAQDSSFLYNVEEIRKEAARSIDHGAVTPDYALDVKQAHNLLNQALATEILCVLRYRHHEITAKGINREEVAAEFREHAMNEEQHMLLIANRINELGGDPDLNPLSIAGRTATEYGNASDLRAMIREDLVAERIVIEIYRKMIEWFGTADPTTRRMLEKILKDEEHHANDLADLLASHRSRDQSLS